MSDKGLGELERLTVGERLLIARRRAKETQVQAARRYGITPFVYGQHERDVSRTDGIDVKIAKLERHEACLLYRRRAGYNQQRVAEELGCCRYWLNQMEQGFHNCDELIWYWEQ